MIWAGEPFARLIEFSTGAPTGALVYSLVNDTGTVLTNGSVTIAAGSVSYLLVVDGAHNTVQNLFEGRTLQWSYSTTNGLVVDRCSYRVGRNIPFPVSTAGVRTKIGLSEVELPDDEIDLLRAYSDVVTKLDLGSVAAGSRTALLVSEAIEAQAALSTLPSLQLRVANKESSGSNIFQRFASIDWKQLEEYLLSIIEQAAAAITPVIDVTQGAFVFTSFRRGTDAITG